MITIGVIFLIILLVFAFTCIWIDEPMAAVCGLILAILLGICIIFMAKDEEEIIDEDVTPTVNVIYDVVDFQIDTNIVVDGTDTLKTYTITYLN